MEESIIDWDYNLILQVKKSLKNAQELPHLFYYFDEDAQILAHNNGLISIKFYYQLFTYMSISVYKLIYTLYVNHLTIIIKK